MAGVKDAGKKTAKQNESQEADRVTPNNQNRGEMSIGLSNDGKLGKKRGANNELNRKRRRSRPGSGGSIEAQTGQVLSPNALASMDDGMVIKAWTEGRVKVKDPNSDVPLRHACTAVAERVSSAYRNKHGFDLLTVDIADILEYPPSSVENPSEHMLWIDMIARAKTVISKEEESPHSENGMATESAALKRYWGRDYL